MENRQYTLRSGVEKKLADYLTSSQIYYEYEVLKLPYEIPSSQHPYTLDFKVLNERTKKYIFIETKGVFRGRWPVADRKKHIYIRERNFNSDIHFVFQNPKAKIAPNAKMTVSQWATDNGFKWCGIEDTKTLEEWLK